MLSSASIGPLKVVALSRPQACRQCLRHLVRPSLVRLHSDFTPINPSTIPKRKTSSLTSDDAVPNPYQVTPRLRSAVVSVLKAAPRSVDNTAPIPTILSLHSSRATPICPTKNGSSSSRSMSTQSTTGPTEETTVAAEQASENLDDVLPHRRRALRKKLSAAGPDGTPTVVIPPDASSLLTTSSAAASSSLKRSMLAFLSLSKPRLTALIVLTTMTSYALFPVDPLLASPAAPTLSALTLVYLTAGTALSSASANALNMAFEPAFDAQMSRTKNRPLVRGLLSKPQAIGFAALAGSLGVAALHIGVNPTVAALGALNIFLYAGVYTPMKRISITNTWIGAIVGGIPPLMGWAAAAGSTATEGTALELLSHPGGWLLASLLFAWQFPHFNALSWTIREEYKAAGYRMMAWVNPALNGRVALRYSVLFFPICFGLWWYGVTDPGFVVTSSVVNAWLTREAWRFYKYGGEKGRARGLFWASVWHLPLLLVLAMAHKEGIWRGVYEKFWVKPAEDEGEWEDEEEGEEEEQEEQATPLTAVTRAVQVVPIKR